jgi:hypothetical protein
MLYCCCLHCCCLHCCCCYQQIDRLVSRAFRNLKADEVLNFSVAVTVMRVQRKWRARMRAAKLKRKREVCGCLHKGLVHRQMHH